MPDGGMGTGGLFGTDAEIREALGVAAAWTVDVVRGIADDQWGAPGLGEWNVRELVAHTSRGLTVIERYLDMTEADEEPMLDSATTYFRLGLSVPDVHTAVAQRAREEQGSLGDDPAAYVAAARDRVLARVAATPAGAPCATLIGVMRIEDYLLTRVAELILHTIDLARATGQPVAVPTLPGRLVLGLLATLAGDDQLPDLLAALSGRGSLPAGFDVLGFGPSS